MTLVRTTFHIASVVNGESAVSYEIALDTNSVTADGDTGMFLTKKLGKFRFIKHTGSDTEECTDVLESFNFLILLIGKDGTILPGGAIYGGASGEIYEPFSDGGIKEEDVCQIKYFWYSGPIIEPGDHDYTKSLISTLGIPSKNMLITILASNTFSVVRQGATGNPGARGSSGPIWRQHVGFVTATADAPYQYYTGSNDERFIDVVLIDKVWYRCLQSYKSTGTDDVRNTTTSEEFAKYWTSADMAGFTFIATEFLLADNAKINLFGSNEINLYGSDAEGKIFGSFRVVDDINNWSLWLGGETGDSASFAVKRNGYLKATNADISGRINATSGSVGGFNIGDNAIGTFDGSTGAGFNQSYMQFTGSDFFHGQGYFIACGNYAGKGLYIDSTVSSSNNLCAGIQVRVKAGDVAPSDPVDGGNMCTALDLFTQWTGQTGSFDVTNPYEGNHAIVIRGGDVIGLRPSFVRIAASYELTEYNHTIECYNTSAITLTLPYPPKYGQCYTIIQRGSRVVFSSSDGIYDTRNASSATTWYTDTRGQISWLWYNGNQWIVSYASR